MSETDRPAEAGTFDKDGAEGLPENLFAWPPVTFELVLRKPVTFKDVTYDSVDLREPTGAEFEAIMDQPEKLRRCFSVSHVGKIPLGAARMIGIGDLVRGEAYLTSFFDIGQVIGVS